MKIRLFGKDLFEFHAKAGDQYAVPAYNHIKESKYLPDFEQMGGNGTGIEWVAQSVATWNGGSGVAFTDTNTSTVTIASPVKPRENAPNIRYLRWTLPKFTA